MTMAKTTDSLKIMDQMIGDDPDLRTLITEALGRRLEITLAPRKRAA